MWKETNSGLARDTLSTQYHAVERERGKYRKKKGNTKTRRWSLMQGWLLRNKLTAGPGWHGRARLRKWLIEDLTRFKQAHDDSHPRNTIFRNVSFLLLPNIKGTGKLFSAIFCVTITSGWVCDYGEGVEEVCAESARTFSYSQFSKLWGTGICILFPPTFSSPDPTEYPALEVYKY